MPYRPITEAQFRHIEELVDAVVLAPSKAEAKEPSKRLEALARQLAADLNTYQHEKLRDVIAYASEASGSVQDKDRRCQAVKNSLGKLRMAAVSAGD